MNRRNDDKEQKEIETTGHDRFCQERPSRYGFRKHTKFMVYFSETFTNGAFMIFIYFVLYVFASSYLESWRGERLSRKN